MQITLNLLFYIFSLLPCSAWKLYHIIVMVSPCNNLVVTMYQIHHLAPRHVDSLRLRAPLMSPVIIVGGGAPCQPPAAVVLLLLLLSLSLCRRITLPVPVSSGDHRCVVVSHSASHSITARLQVSFVYVDIVTKEENFFASRFDQSTC